MFLDVSYHFGPSVSVDPNFVGYRQFSTSASGEARPDDGQSGKQGAAFPVVDGSWMDD